MKKFLNYKYIFKKKNKKNKQIKLTKGNWGLISTEVGIFTEKHLEVMVSIIKKYLNKNISFFVNKNFNKIKSKQNIGNRMGGGKGIIDIYYIKVYPNTVLVEILIKSKFQIIFILRRIASILPFKTSCILKNF